MDDDLQETARALLAGGCKLLVQKDAPVEPALELMDAALLLSPFLRVYAVSFPFVVGASKKNCCWCGARGFTGGQGVGGTGTFK